MSFPEGDLGLHDGALGGEDLWLKARKRHLKCSGGCLALRGSRLALGTAPMGLAAQAWSRIHTGISGIVLRLVESSQWACKVKHVEAWLQGKEDIDRFLVSNS